MKRVVVLNGGGIKSAVTAARYAPEYDLTLLHVDYGQTGSAMELAAVNAICSTFPQARVTQASLPYPGMISPIGSTRNAPQDSSLSPSAVRGILPVLLAVGNHVALQVGATKVATGLSRYCEAVHLGHFAPDGRLDRLHSFLHAFNLMGESMSPNSTARVTIEAPLTDIAYREIVKLARRFELPLEKTWSCEKSGPRPCRKCPACKARALAFAQAEEIDPLSVQRDQASVPAQT